MRLSVATVVLFCASCGAAASAQVFQAGDNEISFTASYNDFDFGTDDGFDLGSEETLEASLTYGRFITNAFEVGVIAGFTDQESDGGDVLEDSSFDSNSIGGFVAYNFPTQGNAVPYLAASIEMIGGDLGDFYDLAYGVGAGVKVYPFEHAGFVFGIDFDKLQGEEDLPDADSLTLMGGLVFKW